MLVSRKQRLIVLLEFSLILAYSALDLTFLATVWPSFPFPKKDPYALSLVKTPCWNLGTQEGKISICAHAEEHA